MEYIEPQTDATLKRLADLGVNVYDIRADHGKESRLQVFKSCEQKCTDPVEYCCQLVDIIDRCETELINKTVKITELKDEIYHEC